MELTSLLSESASQELVNSIVDIIEQEVEKRMLAKEKIRLILILINHIEMLIYQCFYVVFLLL